MSRVRILCVDPDPESREETVAGLESALSELDPAVETAATVGDAAGALDGVDCVVTEYDLPDGSGIDVVERARATNPDAGCILFTAADRETVAAAAPAGTVAEYLRRDAAHAHERLARLVRTTVTGWNQTSYPLPADEGDRLDALRTYDLDVGSLKASLERVVDLAAAHFEVHSASVNILDAHSQEFLACHGAAADWESMDREDSICTFTILEDDVMTVEDVTEDPRFESRSDALLELGIRSYMGANLVTPAGLVIGPLCVYDDEPRSFSAAEGEYLRTLAAVAMDLVDLHARIDAAADGDGETGRR